MSQCIVNFATNTSWYPRGQNRLLESLNVVGYHGNTMFIAGERKLGCKSHQENPYSFKTHILLKAKNTGHRFLLWCDCSVWAVVNPQPVFDLIEKQGHILIDSGWSTGQWCTDSAMEKFGATRDELMAMPMISSGFVGLDMHNPKSVDFLNQWHTYSQSGVFAGAWTNENQQCSSDPRVLGHRHDQTAASFLANKLDMKISSTGFFSYAEYYEAGNTKDIYFIARGM
jgi:hypothetical protein